MRTMRFLLASLAVFVLTTAAGRAADADKYFPDDTETVVSFNIKQLLESPIVKSNIPALKAAIKAKKELQSVLDEIGIDPFKDIDAINFVSRSDSHEGIIIIGGRFNRIKMQNAVEKMAKGDKAKLTVHDSNGLKINEIQGQGFVCFLDDSTVVTSGAKNSLSDAISIKVGTRKQSLNREFEKLAGSANRSSSISIVSLEPFVGNDLAPGIGDKVKTITGGMDITSEIKVDFVAMAKDETSAKFVADKATQEFDRIKQLIDWVGPGQKQFGPIKDFLDQFKIATAKNSVTIKGTASKDSIEKIVKDDFAMGEVAPSAFGGNRLSNESNQPLLDQPMKVTYDAEVDVLRILLNDSVIEESDEDKPGVVLDYDKDGNLVGLEILDASRRVENPRSLEHAVVG